MRLANVTLSVVATLWFPKAPLIAEAICDEPLIKVFPIVDSAVAILPARLELTVTIEPLISEPICEDPLSNVFPI